MNKQLWKMCTAKYHVGLLQGVGHWTCYTVNHMLNDLTALWSWIYRVNTAIRSLPSSDSIKQHYLFQERDGGTNFSSSCQEEPLIQLGDGEVKLEFHHCLLDPPQPCTPLACQSPASTPPYIAQHCLCRCCLQDSAPSLSVSVQRRQRKRFLLYPSSHF